MGPIFSLTIVLFVAFFVIRAGTAALTLLGLSRDLALFQAISAFTGVGFTTSESEHILTHPDRRRVVMALMVVGNVGLISAMSSLVLTFARTGNTSEALEKLVWLVVGLSLVSILLTRRRVALTMHRIFRHLLRKTGRLQVQDFVDLLQLTGDYGVLEVSIDSGHWLADRPLAESRLLEEGVTVLGIHRPDGVYIGVPRGETRIESGDTLILYGREEAVERLQNRRRDIDGESEHDRAVRGTRRERAARAWEDRRRIRDEEGDDAADGPMGGAVGGSVP